MATIHVNTDLMRQLGQVFVQLNEEISNQIQPQIQNHIGQLEGDWQGVSRQRFEQMFLQWRTAVDQVVLNGEDISRHLQDTAQRFESVDQSEGAFTGQDVSVLKYRSCGCPIFALSIFHSYLAARASTSVSYQKDSFVGIIKISLFTVSDFLWGRFARKRRGQ